VVGWEVCCGVGWKEEEVTGRRVQECDWLSAKPADKTEQKPTRTRISGKWRKYRRWPLGSMSRLKVESKKAPRRGA